MKIIIIFLVTIICGLYVKANRIIENSVVLSDITKNRDTLKMPDVDDTFIILTSDTASYGKEGIFRQERIGENGKMAIIYHLISRSRALRAIFEYDTSDTCAFRKFVLPRTFLDKIDPVDMDYKFPRFKYEKELWEVFNWPYKELTQEDVKKLLEMSWEEWILREQELPGIRSAWLIDRRYMTADSVSLLKVSVNLNIEEFNPQ